MTTKRKTHQTARAGEYAVASELNRRGFDTVTFTGNMPEIDLIALTPEKKALRIQVKSQTGSGWLVNVDERLKEPQPDMFWALVLLPKAEDEPPRFWIISDKQMREKVIQKRYEEKIHLFAPGRPRWCKIEMWRVADFEGGWSRLTQSSPDLC